MIILMGQIEQTELKKKKLFQIRTVINIRNTVYKSFESNV